MTQRSATDRKSIREAEKASAELDRQSINFLVSAMGIPQGRLFFYQLLDFCQAFRVDPTFETNRDYLALGQRNVGMRLFSDIMTHCPNQFSTMMQEAHDRHELSRARQLPRSQGPDGSSAGPGADSDPADHDPYAEPDSE